MFPFSFPKSNSQVTAYLEVRGKNYVLAGLKSLWKANSHLSSLARETVYHRRGRKQCTSGLIGEKREGLGHRSTAGCYLTACPVSAGQARCCLKMNHSLARAAHSNEISEITWGPKIEICLFKIRCIQFHYHSKMPKACIDIEISCNEKNEKLCSLWRLVKRSQQNDVKS